MCLAVPGKLLAIELDGVTGTIDFQGSRFPVNISCTPDAKVGSWLLVHAGFSISALDEDEAREIWDVLQHDETIADQRPAELTGKAKP